MKIGRPLIFNSPEDMIQSAETYFAECFLNKEPITITGLAMALGLASRQALINYEGRPEFNDTVKRLKLVCENFAERKIYGNNPTGAIFALKNYGWQDKQEVEHSGGMLVGHLLKKIEEEDALPKEVTRQKLPTISVLLDQGQTATASEVSKKPSAKRIRRKSLE